MANWNHCLLSINGPDNEIKRLLKNGNGRAVTAGANGDPAYRVDPFCSAILVPIAEAEELCSWITESFNPNTVSGSAFISLRSRNAPPIMGIQYVSKNYPALQFELQYHEFGLGWSGTSIMKNGVESDWWHRDWLGGTTCVHGETDCFHKHMSDAEQSIPVGCRLQDMPGYPPSTAQSYVSDNPFGGDPIIELFGGHLLKKSFDG